jgi:hypothetical protein
MMMISMDREGFSRVQALSSEMYGVFEALFIASQQGHMAKNEYVKASPLRLLFTNILAGFYAMLVSDRNDRGPVACNKKVVVVTGRCRSLSMRLMRS